VEIKILRGQTQPSIKQQLGDDKVKTGDNIVLHNILFVGSMHQFLKSSAQPLMDLLEAMQTYPKLVIRVEGHICCQPGDGDGLDMETGMENLSEERGKAVMDYLIRNGIAPNRISYKGFGHSRPLYPFPEKTEAEQTANRRVEIKILSK
jgi:outer membrane protein OmpA-like peptidoglycan-associated protein